MDCSLPGSFVLHYLPEFAQICVHWISDVIQPSHPLSPFLLLSSIFPSIKVFSNELALHIRCPKYWSFDISPSSEYLRVDFCLINTFLINVFLIELELMFNVAFDYIRQERVQQPLGLLLIFSLHFLIKQDAYISQLLALITATKGLWAALPSVNKYMHHTILG